MGVGPGHLSAGYRRPAGLLTQGGLVTHTPFHPARAPDVEPETGRVSPA